MADDNAETGTVDRIVLDTNTVLALWHFGDPKLERLHNALESHRLKVFSRADALEELRLVLAYRQLGLSEASQAELYDHYVCLCTIMPEVWESTEPLPVCRDRDDQKFLEIASQAEANYLISRDKAVLRMGRHRLIRARFAILTPERYMLERPAPGP